MNEQLEHLHKINSKMKINGYNKSAVIWFSLKPQGNIVITVKTGLTGKLSTQDIDFIIFK